MKENKKSNAYALIPLILIVLIPAVFCLVPGFHIVKSGKQIYDDFIIGEIAYYADNKTGEWRVLWTGMFLGIITAAVCAFCMRIKSGDKEDEKDIFDVFIKNASYFLMILFSIWSVIIFASTLLSKRTISSLVVLAIAVLCFGFAKFVNREGSRKAISILSIPIPLLLFVFLKNTYEFGGSLVKIGHPFVYRVIIVLIIVAMIAGMIYRYFFSKNKDKADIIPYSVCLSVFTFVSSIPAAMMEQHDLHHHGEQILPFQQIFLLGEKAYSEYYPSSGFYPVPIGAINHFLFKDSFNCYSLSYILFMFSFEAVLIYLLYRRLGGRMTLFISFMFHMPVYCRTWIIPIAILILSDRALIKKRVAWIAAWILICLLCGLYYPLFAVAILAGTLPYGIMNVISLIKKKEELKKVNKKEITFFIAVLCVVMLFIPVLLRMLKHILSMSSQTMLSESMAVMGKELPDFFMPFLSKISEINRQRLYYFLRMYLGIPFVGVSVYVALILIKRLWYMRKENSAVEDKDKSAFILSVSIPIILCVSYTYTFVCMDEEWVARLLSRSAHVILLACIIPGIVYLKENKERVGGLLYKALMISCFVVPFFFFFRNGDYEFPRLAGTTDVSSFVLFDYDEKADPYPVADEYVPSDEALYASYPFVDRNRFGDGFVRESNVATNNGISDKLARLREFDPEIKLMGNEESQGNYYLLNEKSVYSGKVSIAKGRDASKAVIDKIDPKHTVVRPTISSLREYYIVRYLFDNDFVYSSELDLFIPNELYNRIFGTEGNLYGSIWTMSIDTYRAAGAYGESMGTMDCLKEIYTSDLISKTADNSFDIMTDTTLKGKDADFLYLELEGTFDKNTVNPEFIASWDDIANPEISVTGECFTEKLLIPLGTNADWYIREHNKVNLNFEGENAETVNITKATFYKLKDL